MGKTSLLLHLARTLKQPLFPVYFDLNHKAMDTVSQVLFEMALAAADRAAIAPPAQPQFADNPAAFHEIFLPRLYQALGHRQQPVFLLDEFEAIDLPEAELPQTAAVRNLDTYIYRLLTSQTRTDFIFAAGRRMSEFNNVQTSGFEANLTQRVSVLDLDQTRALILQDGAPKYEEPAVACIVDMTRGHPYLTQLVCHTLFEQTQNRPDQTIATKDVKAAVTTLLTLPDTALPQIWASIPPAEQLTLAAAAKRMTKPGSVLNVAALESGLSQASVGLDPAGLRSAPGNLVNWQLFEQSSSGYTFFIDLIRRWVAANRPPAQIIDAPKTAPDQLPQQALPEQTAATQPPQTTETKAKASVAAAGPQQQNWWPLALVAGVLLLLVCGWLYSSNTLSQENAVARNTICSGWRNWG